MLYGSTRDLGDVQPTTIAIKGEFETKTFEYVGSDTNLDELAGEECMCYIFKSGGLYSEDDFWACINIV